MELRLASGHFSVAGAELANEVMPVEKKKTFCLDPKVMFFDKRNRDVR